MYTDVYIYEFYIYIISTEKKEKMNTPKYKESSCYLSSLH